MFYRLLEEADKKAESLEREGGNVLSQNGSSNNVQGGNGAVRRRQAPRSQEINKNGPNLSCLLTRMNPDMALKTHALYEIGGNIGKHKNLFKQACGRESLNGRFRLEIFKLSY